mmetsp:Transcript_29217/g.69570  ORF Transcript_29217/g.69570 Transcript_29217/m.69570 type:complete len:237 (-) Transcript_29217:196-906(-)
MSSPHPQASTSPSVVSHVIVPPQATTSSDGVDGVEMDDGGGGRPRAVAGLALSPSSGVGGRGDPAPTPLDLLNSALTILSSSRQHSGHLCMRTFHPLPNAFFFLSLTFGWRTHLPLSSYSCLLIVNSLVRTRGRCVAMSETRGGRLDAEAPCEATLRSEGAEPISVALPPKLLMLTLALPALDFRWGGQSPPPRRPRPGWVPSAPGVPATGGSLSWPCRAGPLPLCPPPMKLMKSS